MVFSFSTDFHVKETKRKYSKISNRFNKEDHRRAINHQKFRSDVHFFYFIPKGCCCRHAFGRNRQLEKMKDLLVRKWSNSLHHEVVGCWSCLSNENMGSEECKEYIRTTQKSAHAHPVLWKSFNNGDAKIAYASITRIPCISPTRTPGNHKRLRLSPE